MIPLCLAEPGEPQIIRKIGGSAEIKQHLETLGFNVAVVDCGYENVKITTPKDVAVAEAIIKKRRSENG